MNKELIEKRYNAIQETKDVNFCVSYDTINGMAERYAEIATDHFTPLLAEAKSEIERLQKELEEEKKKSTQYFSEAEIWEDRYLRKDLELDRITGLLKKSVWDNAYNIYRANTGNSEYSKECAEKSLMDYMNKNQITNQPKG